jgi:hypothetical protein
MFGISEISKSNGDKVIESLPSSSFHSLPMLNDKFQFQGTGKSPSSINFLFFIHLAQ